MTTLAQATIYGLFCVCAMCREVHPGRIRYVGQTIQSLRERIYQHRSAARVGKRLPVYDWVRKHGAANIRAFVLEPNAQFFDDLNAAEKYWISHLDTFKNGLNMTEGGDQSGYRHDPATRERMASQKRGIPVHSDEHKKDLSIRFSGEGNPAAKTTRRVADSIRLRYALGDRAGDIQRSEGVSEAVYLSIINNKNWVDPAWIKPSWNDIQEKRQARGFKYKGARSLSMSQEKEVISRYAKGGITQKVLALEFGVDPSVISRTITGNKKRR